MTSAALAELEQLEAQRVPGMDLEARMELEDRIFEAKRKAGLIKIDRESSYFECVGCGS
jgi:hypothetical protein